MEKTRKQERGWIVKKNQEKKERNNKVSVQGGRNLIFKIKNTIVSFREKRMREGWREEDKDGETSAWLFRATATGTELGSPREE